MTDDLHPFIARGLSHTLGPHGQNNFRSYAMTQFLRLDNTGRIALLNALDNELNNDDGTGLRKKSQLLSVGRELRGVHQQLQRMGR